VFFIFYSFSLFNSVLLSLVPLRWIASTVFQRVEQRVVAALHNSEAAGISPAALKLADITPEAPWTTLEIKGAEKFTELEK